MNPPQVYMFFFLGLSVYFKLMILLNLNIRLARKFMEKPK